MSALGQAAFPANWGASRLPAAGLPVLYGRWVAALHCDTQRPPSRPPNPRPLVCCAPATCRHKDNRRAPNEKSKDNKPPLME